MRSVTKPSLPGWTAVVAATLLLSGPAVAEIRITLKNAFIEKYKNRATIDATFTVDRAHKKPNPPAKDGDMHLAGRAPEIGLPIVAELMNAASEPTLVNRVHAVEGKEQPIQLSGAWRIWAEHGGGSDQVQGAALGPFATSNPDHVFEIHPVSTFEGKSLTPDLRPINGYSTKDAMTAFQSYENLKCRIIPGEDSTTIETPMGGFNYVEFILVPTGAPMQLEDGFQVMGRVLTLDGDLVARNRRMVFIKGSAPEGALKKLVSRFKENDSGEDNVTLHVLGIPRIDLSLVSWRAQHGKERPEVLQWNLPYEIIVVAAYPR